MGRCEILFLKRKHTATCFLHDSRLLRWALVKWSQAFWWLAAWKSRSISPTVGKERGVGGRWRAGAWRPVTGGGLTAGDGRLRSGWRRAIDRLRRGGRFINLAHSCGVVQSINNRFNFRIFKLMYLLIWTFSPKRISPKEFDSNWIQFGFSFWVRVFSINFQPISNQFNPFFDHFPTIFHPTIVHFLGQFSANFQPIFSQFSVNFQSI